MPAVAARQAQLPGIAAARRGGLSPARPPEDREGLVHSIREHLRPALAPNAVAALDTAIEAAVAGAPG